MAGNIRICVKRDHESPIGRGCVLRAGHFRPEISIMTWACAKAASEIDPAIRELWITEGDRPWDGEGRDLHPELRALDYTFRHATGTRPTDSNYHRIAARMKEILGYDYDLRAHAADDGEIHIHSELDPK